MNFIIIGGCSRKMKKTIALLVILLMLGMSSITEAMPDIEEALEMINSGKLSPSIISSYQPETESAASEKAMYFFLKGYLETREFEFNSAYESFNKSLEILLEHPNPRLEAELLFYISEIELLYMDLPNGMSHSLRLGELATAQGLDKRLIDSYYNLAIGYRYYYDERESNKYSAEAYSLSKEIGYDFGEALYFAFLGDTRLDYENDPEGAMEAYQESYRMMPEKNRDQLREDYRIILDSAMIYTRIFHLEDKTVLPDIERVISGSNPKNYIMLYDLKALAGDVYLSDEPEKALSYYLEAMELYEKIEAIPTSAVSSYYLESAIAKTYYELGEYQSSADIYYKLLTGENDEGLIRQLMDTQSSLDDYKYDSYQERLALLEDFNETNEAKVQLSKRLSAVFISSTILLLIALVAIVIGLVKNRRIQDKLYKASITDNLTKVYNRSKIIEIINENLGSRDAIAMIDVDDFKKINDTYGHLVGDQVLIRISDTIRSSVRSVDSVGRYGGEEFIVHFKDVSVQEAIEISERIRTNIMNMKWDCGDIKTTVSIGVSMGGGRNLDDVLSYADELMYRAKSSGKNRLEARISLS